MRLRTLAAAFVVSAVATLPLAGVAAASDGDTCPPPAPAEPAEPITLDVHDTDDSDDEDDSDDYSEDEDDSDDYSDDEDSSDDEATSDEAEPAPAEAEVTCTQVAVVPVGGVETGDGSSPTDPTPALVVIFGASALGVGAVVRRAVRQSG